MVDWNTVVRNYFRISDPQQQFQHLAPPAATEAAIQAVEADLGVPLPADLRSFYATCNGVGLGLPDDTDSPRFIRAVEDLPLFVLDARSIFSDTHPDYASRFLPFLDWENGDVTGYVFEEDGTLLPYLVTFMHELYQGSEDQDINDFLQPAADNLVDLLNPAEEDA